MVEIYSKPVVKIVFFILPCPSFSVNSLQTNQSSDFNSSLKTIVATIVAKRHKLAVNYFHTFFSRSIYKTRFSFADMKPKLTMSANQMLIILCRQAEIHSRQSFFRMFFLKSCFFIDWKKRFVFFTS